MILLDSIIVTYIICWLPIIIPYLIVGFIIGSFAGDDGTLEDLGILGQILALLIMLGWPLFLLFVWLFGEK